jgi:hypothetical protein
MKRSQSPTSGKRLKARDWRTALYGKTFKMQAWDWKEDPAPNIRALCRPLRVRLQLKQLNLKDPERVMKAVAREHRLHLYDVPSLEGSGVYGFILCREALSRREIQQIEADYWGEDFEEVYR